MANIVFKLIPSFGFGSDGIASSVIKIALQIMYPFFCDFLNFSTLSGAFPDCWKINRVAHVVKDGKIEDESSHRTISVLPVILRPSKIDL